MNKLSANKQSFINAMTKSDEHARRGFEILLKRKDFADYFDPLKAAGLFDKSKNSGPKPAQQEGYFYIPYWEALPYLLAVAKVAGEKNDSELANKILEIIRDITNERENGAPKDNYNTWNAFAEIYALLPVAVLSIADINLIPVWLEGKFNHGLVGHTLAKGLLAKLLASSNEDELKKACLVLYHCTAVRWVKKQGIGREKEEPESVMDGYWLKELVLQNATILGKKCPKDAALIFLMRLDEVFSSKEYKNSSWLFRPAIEQNPQNYDWRTLENSFVGGLRDILISWLEEEPEDAKEFIAKLLKDGEQISRRIAIYLINNNYDQLKKLFESTLAYLSESGYLHELYDLLEARFGELDQEDKEKVVKAILELPIPNGEDGEKRQKRSQRIWLSAIKAKGSPKADAIFEELVASPEIGGVSPHPNFYSYMQSGWGFGPSLYQSPELLAFLDEGTLIQKLNEFQESQDWSAPTVRALTDALEEAVTKEPSKFLEKLEIFATAHRPYQYAIISGFHKLWGTTTKDEIDLWNQIWEKLISFFEGLLFSPEFWTEPVDVEESRTLTPTKDWIAPIICDFLRAGVKDDAKALPPSLLPRVWLLISKLIETLPSEWNLENTDSMTQAINLPKGKAIEALINYTLFVSRHSDREQQEHASKWQEMRVLFDSELHKCRNDNYEFSTLMGAYLANLDYLSREWLKTNIAAIFPAEYPENFACAIRGLAYANASREIYTLLNDSGIINTALKREIKERHARENLIQRVALAYLWGDENLDDTNFQYLSENGHENDLCEMTRFFWGIQNQEVKKEQIERILAFWDWCMKWADKQEKPPESLLSMTALLICYLDSISDKNKEWLLKSAPYVPKKHNADFFLEGLFVLVEDSPQAVVDILKKLIEIYEPAFDYKNMLYQIIERLVEAGFKADAIEFANKLHRMKGFQELYAKLTV